MDRHTTSGRNGLFTPVGTSLSQASPRSPVSWRSCSGKPCRLYLTFCSLSPDSGIKLGKSPFLVLDVSVDKLFQLESLWWGRSVKRQTVLDKRRHCSGLLEWVSRVCHSWGLRRPACSFAMFIQGVGPNPELMSLKQHLQTGKLPKQFECLP